MEWELDMLYSPEDWRWLWSLGQATTPSSSPTLLNHQSPPSHNASSVNPWTMYALNAPNTSAPSVGELPQDTLNALSLCAHAQSVESLVMWAPVAQLQPQLTITLHLSVHC